MLIISVISIVLISYLFTKKRQKSITPKFFVRGGLVNDVYISSGEVYKLYKLDREKCVLAGRECPHFSIRNLRTLEPKKDGNYSLGFLVDISKEAKCAVVNHLASLV